MLHLVYLPGNRNALPIDRDFRLPTPRKPPKSMTAARDLPGSIDDDIDDPPHILVGGAANLLAEDALRRRWLSRTVTVGARGPPLPGGCRLGPAAGLSSCSPVALGEARPEASPGRRGRLASDVRTHRLMPQDCAESGRQRWVPPAGRSAPPPARPLRNLPTIETSRGHCRRLELRRTDDRNLIPASSVISSERGALRRRSIHRAAGCAT